MKRGQHLEAGSIYSLSLSLSLDDDDLSFCLRFAELEGDICLPVTCLFQEEDEV